MPITDLEPYFGVHLTPEQIQVAREAVSKVEGALRFLRKQDDEFATDLMEFYDAVAPVVRTHHP